MYTWYFTAGDNGGYFQRFKVKASNRQDAIRKGMERARKHAKGDITGWDCKLALIV